MFACVYDTHENYMQVLIKENDCIESSRRWNPENQIESCSCLLLDACLRCQAENKQEDCVVVWGECNHSFHNCCMSLWVKQNNRCPLCQQDWVVQRIGK
ncbi:PREDICTED: RING-box protein 2 [Pygoscelis adeliae]|uniref:RING-box protein 2 n=1 Tax=Pygoscelis adeliae TaxID=9238 RepID=UPI0004F4EE1B|nr:PREDICTED: RING-box protein 2 [Pygoscelis adeliae]